MFAFDQKKTFAELGNWDWHIYTTLYRTETNENLLYSKGTQCFVVINRKEI